MLGITPLPERIVFRCRRCGRSLGVSRDPGLLRKRGMPDAIEPKPAAPDAVPTAPAVEEAVDAAPAAEAKGGGSSPL
jgi:hypothetical protein